MKKTIIIILVILIVAYIGIVIFTRTNNSAFTSRTVDLKVECSSVKNLLITSTVNIEVTNLSSRRHRNVTVQVSGQDNNGNATKEKFITFDRALEANSSMSKTVILPAKTKSCTCNIVNSNPE